jgi:hypothetical protein
MPTGGLIGRSRAGLMARGEPGGLMPGELAVLTANYQVVSFKKKKKKKKEREREK